MQILLQFYLLILKNFYSVYIRDFIKFFLNSFFSLKRVLVFNLGQQKKNRFTFKFLQVFVS